MTRARIANHKCLTMLVVFLVSCGGLLASSSAAASGRKEVHQVPAVYVFGDSTVDVGNNQHLPWVEPLQLPYGIDYPHSMSTGRFSNGYNIADCIAQLLGFKESPPAYLSLTAQTSRQIFSGVNYASGASGILDTTGDTITLTKQVEYFAATKARMMEIISPLAVDELLAKSLFLISDGGNDMFAFIRQNRTVSADVQSFYKEMYLNYKRHVKALYKLGARRFGIIDVPPVGCVPAARARYPSGDTMCVPKANSLAQGFNFILGMMMTELAGNLTGMRYSIGSSYNLVTYFTAHPEVAEFREVASACCGGGRLNGETKCEPDTKYCDNRKDYLFWDGVHGTQASSKKGAEIIYSAPSELGFATPINFKELISANDAPLRFTS